ncbi:hypothetical protein GCM10027418_20000 [Mariniluteicoccus endophyticus]
MKPTVVRAGDPAELLSLIPYIVGVEPAESLVVLGLSGTRVVATARVDLDDCLFRADQVAAAALGQGADSVILAVYAASRDGIDDLLDLFASMLPLELSISEAFLVRDSRYWCMVPGCECADGIAFDPSTTRTAADAVLAGMRVAPSREALAGLVAGPEGDRADDVDEAYERVAARVADLDDPRARDALALRVEEFLLAPRRLTDDECAELSMLVAQPTVRDVATLRVRRVDAETHVDLWSQVARASAPPFDVAPVCLAGLAAWVSGDGVLLNVCIERAEAMNPDFSLLQILQDISDMALPPDHWEPLRAEMEKVAWEADGRRVE